jgi:hypothetical protein
MHWMDRLVALSSRFEVLYPPLFPEGWGDQALLERYQDQARTPASADRMELEWSQLEPRDGLHVAEASFVSPVTDLQSSSRQGHLRMISQTPEPDRICLLMASFNDHGYRTRSSLAGLLAQRGIASVLLENPLYGRRRVNSHKQAIRTVLDLMVMGYSAAIEGSAILHALSRTFTASLGVSGYSMGGNIAALISAATPLTVAVAPLAPSHSPGPVYAEGVLSRTVDWHALGGPQPDRLAEVLGAASALNFPPPAGGAVLAAARGDGYIPRHAVEDLHRHWPGSELRWLSGGHVSLWLTGKEKLADAVESAFERTFGAVFST